MRISKVYSSILVFSLLLMASMPISLNDETVIVKPISNYSSSEEISGVPYVWQEINGFCFPSALSMVLQSMGLDLNLYDILAATGSGFSMVSVCIDETMMLFPGSMVRQIPWFTFFIDLYGLEMQFYMDSGTEYGLDATQFISYWGSEFIDFNKSQVMTPLDVMRETIDSGLPLTISADTYYLPAEDWDFVRDYVGPLQPGGVAHSIVIVGYNDSTQQVQVYDPGVGLMAPNYGYPDDGRWNYNMSYSTLDDAWSSCGYATFKVTNDTGPMADFEEQLASYVAQRMLGNRSEYFEGYFLNYFFRFEDYPFIGTGADAFRRIGRDMNPRSIRNYCSFYIEDEKPMALKLLGHSLELMLTTQYLAYRTSLESLPDLLPSMNLTSFFVEASEALPHLEVLSHNLSITGGMEIESRDSLLYNTFFGIAQSFESSNDLVSATNEFSVELDEISNHLIDIADAWQAASWALFNELGIYPEMPNESLILIVGGVTGVLIIGVMIVVWRKKSAPVD